MHLGIFAYSYTCTQVMVTDYLLHSMHMHDNNNNNNDNNNDKSND